MSTLSTGFEEPASTQEVSVYPNPAKEKVMVKSESPIESISLYNIQGVLLKQFNVNDFETTIHIDNYPASVYVLKIKSGTRRYFTQNCQIIKILQAVAKS
ncbi:T9SS type A sorting domain-containing protein [Flavobacterium sp. 3HN19-14]|uniref:T9SS type A sorting domain-containing protein n=1 Tax=Flavobacterium sp. 3HN19-14 TaxID=3448133 RepID=UPI003EE1902A